jgi:hypothetical protein
VRSFAYQTGPAYGLLLDAYDVSWRKSFRAGDDLDRALRAAAKLTLPDDLAKEASDRAPVYRGAQLHAREETRDCERRERLARLRAALVDGPTLTLPMEDAHFGFDPNGVVPLPGAGTVYVPLDVHAAWGELHATAGVLVTTDLSHFVLSAPADSKGGTLVGEGWTLHLNPGWTTAPGARAGDLQRVRP